jgi:hypothetical protein
MFDFKVHAVEPSIIHEFSSKGCPPDIFLDDLGEVCEKWLRGEYPKCAFFYEPESFVLFLHGGHGLSEDQIHQIQWIANAFVSGLKNGVEMARRPSHNILLAD